MKKKKIAKPNEVNKNEIEQLTVNSYKRTGIIIQHTKMLPCKGTKFVS